MTSACCKRLRILRPVKILLHKRARPRVPPCDVLKKCLFYFFKSNHFILLRPAKSLLQTYVCMYIRLYLCVCVCVCVCIYMQVSPSSAAPTLSQCDAEFAGRRASGFAALDRQWLMPIFRVSENERAEDAKGRLARIPATDHAELERSKSSALKPKPSRLLLFICVLDPKARAEGE